MSFLFRAFAGKTDGDGPSSSGADTVCVQPILRTSFSLLLSLNYGDSLFVDRQIIASPGIGHVGRRQTRWITAAQRCRKGTQAVRRLFSSSWFSSHRSTTFLYLLRFCSIGKPCTHRGAWMDILLRILEQDRSDQDIVAAILDILCIIMSDSDSIPGRG